MPARDVNWTKEAIHSRTREAPQAIIRIRTYRTNECVIVWIEKLLSKERQEKKGNKVRNQKLSAIWSPCGGSEAVEMKLLSRTEEYVCKL